MPIDNLCVAYGQVMASIKPNPLLLGVFERLYAGESRPSLDEITSSPLLYLVNSFDVKIANGDWPVVGWKEPSEINLPNFKLGSGAETMVISYDTKSRRVATPDEAALLEYRNSVSPALLLRAVRAHHRLEPWEIDFDRYKYETAMRSSNVKV